MFKKMSASCFTKCVRRYEPDGDLSVGEGACLERCVHKYLEAYKVVNEHMTERQQRDQALMEQQQQLGGGMSM